MADSPKKPDIGELETTCKQCGADCIIDEEWMDLRSPDRIDQYIWKCPNCDARYTFNMLKG